MSVKVTINGRTFNINDKFRNLITTLAAGDYIGILDGPDDGKRVAIKSTTRIIDYMHTDVSEYVFEGVDQGGFTTQNYDGYAWLHGLGEGNPMLVGGDIAYNFSCAPNNSLFKLAGPDDEGSTYVLNGRYINIVNFDKPSGSGLNASLMFSKR